MKGFVYVLLVLCLTALVVSALPTPQKDDESVVVIPDTVRSDRHRRITCDLLSMSTPMGSLNHSACAAECLAMLKGYRGGYCEKGACHCRK